MLVYQVGGDLQSTFWSCGHVVSGPRARTDHVGVCQVGGDGGEDKKSDAKCSWCRIMSVKTPLTPSPTTRFNLSAVLAEERNQVVPRSPLSPFFLGGKKPFARGRASSPAARLVPDVLLQGPGCSQFSRHVVTGAIQYRSMYSTIKTMAWFTAGQRRPLNSPDPNPPKKRHLHAISQGILVPSPSSLNKTRPSTPGSNYCLAHNFLR